MSATDAPQREERTAQAQPVVERRCPRCAAPLRPEQEWCLNCGTGVGARVAPPRGWRLPLVAVGSLLAVALAAVVLAIVALAGDAEQVTTTQVPPPAQATPTPAPTTAPTAPPAASATPTGAPTGSGLAEWPAGKTGYTVVLDSASTRSAAEARANELASQGISAGVLDTSGYRSLGPDRFVVFSGQYATRPEARKALAGLKDQAAGATVELVEPA